MRSARPALASHAVEVDGDESRALVTLTWKGASFDGAAVGSSTPEARPRLIGEATIRAVESLSEGRLKLDLTAVATTNMGANRIAIAQVVAVGTDGRLVGSAVMPENEPDEATARAVLDAVNRHLEQHLL